jgi:hypothetical protein
MQHRRGVSTLTCCLGIALVGGLGHMLAQQKAALGADKSETVATVDLAEVGLPGRVSVVRNTLNPGTAMGVHKHDGRTSIVTVVQGTLTEHRGDAVNVYHQGDVFLQPVQLSESVTRCGAVSQGPVIPKLKILGLEGCVPVTETACVSTGCEDCHADVPRD